MRIATIPGLTYTTIGLAPSTTYTFQIAAYDLAGNVSPKSTSVSSKTQPTPSTAFRIGDQVRTTAKASVRSAPSGSGTAVGSQPRAAAGKIIGGPWYWNQQWWWKVDFAAGVDGWVSEGKLKKDLPTG
jgi:hypothetical protein